VLLYDPCDLSAIVASQTAQKQGHVMLIPTGSHQLDNSVIELGKLLWRDHLVTPVVWPLVSVSM